MWLRSLAVLGCPQQETGQAACKSSTFADHKVEYELEQNGTLLDGLLRRPQAARLRFRALVRCTSSSSSSFGLSVSVPSALAGRLWFMAKNGSEAFSSCFRSMPLTILALNLSVSFRSFSRKPRACFVT